MYVFSKSKLENTDVQDFREGEEFAYASPISLRQFLVMSVNVKKVDLTPKTHALNNISAYASMCLTGCWSSLSHSFMPHVFCQSHFLHAMEMFCESLTN